MVRIGVYICHCGVNIANMVDVGSVARYALGLPHVAFTRDYLYLCSEPGQMLIQQDIQSRKLNRIIVAACSPLMHEDTFRRVIAQGGLNPFLFHMVNIREQAAWVHEDKDAVMEKAKDLIRSAVHRVVFHRPIERKWVDIHPEVLVVGGGIAGIHASLTLAKAGKHVYLVEREPTIGGHMAQYDKTFPTLDCAACILTPKMSMVKNHPNITLWTYSDILKVEGFTGNYKVQVRRRPRYVHDNRCIGCRECIRSCIYPEPRFPNEFDLGLSKRKPIYIPFPQAVPQVALIDDKTCIQLKSGRCKQPCVKACGERKAIDFEQKETIENIHVGTVIISTGFKAFDAKRISAYGYGIYPDVYTALEMERMASASGPTGGEIVLRNGQKPKRVGIIHCVGSRDVNANSWCSRVCCLYSLKLAHIIKERTDAFVYNFYIDMRTPGRNMEEFHNRLCREGVYFFQGRVSEVSFEDSDTDSGQRVIQAEDHLLGRVLRAEVDMVILAVGMEPSQGTQDIGQSFHINRSKEGFFLERHPKLAPVSTFADGIFLAGCCQGPKDIADTIAQAGAAAAEVLALICSGRMELEPNTAHVVEERCSGCALCIQLCPYGALSFDPERGKAMIEEALCKGCGTCVSTCRSGSIRQSIFGDEEIFSEIEGLFG